MTGGRRLAVRVRDGAAAGSRRSHAPRASSPRSLVRFERAAVLLLLALHAALVLWGAAANSVTFDENFHVPAGVAIVARGDFGVSANQPPLVKAAYGAAALAAGARVPEFPPGDSLTSREALGGEAFLRANADRYHRVYFAARAVALALSLVLATLVWRFARRLYGGAAGLLALALYALAPEALAHAGIAGVDLPTGLGFLATVYGFWGFLVTGRPKWWAWTAAAWTFTFLTRFTAVQLLPILVLQAIAAMTLARVRHPKRVWAGLLLLVPVALLAVNVAYGFRGSFAPLERYRFEAESFRRVQALAPRLPVPLPSDYVRGLHDVALMSEAHRVETFVLGRITRDSVPYYYPLALLVKWPLGFWGALLVRAAWGWRRRGHRPFFLRGILLGIAIGIPLATAVLGNLNVGVRYLFPILPFLCVWCGALAGRAALGAAGKHARRPALVAAVLLAGIQGVESGMAAPYPLSFFNRVAGGPGGGGRIVNDSNVDWGQGLIALRSAMRRFHVERVHLVYHGTTDPAVYGIDSVPYLGGEPGTESDWLAVSSYYMAGLSQRMMTHQGRTRAVRFHFEELARTPAVAAPAGCMFLYRLRNSSR